MIPNEIQSSGVKTSNVTRCSSETLIPHPILIPHGANRVRYAEVGEVSQPAEEDFGERRRSLETTAVVGPQRGA